MPSTTPSTSSGFRAVSSAFCRWSTKASASRSPPRRRTSAGTFCARRACCRAWSRRISAPADRASVPSSRGRRQKIGSGRHEGWYLRARSVQIALIGDYSATVIAHQAIPLALQRAGAEAAVEVRFTWHHTAQLGARPEAILAGFAGVWCVPGSPYADATAALAAIRFARQQLRPFLGTCGGFQHALLEYAHNVLGMAGAAHAEIDANAPDPLITPLSCALLGQSGEVSLVSGSRLAKAYGTTAAV